MFNLIFTYFTSCPKSRNQHNFPTRQSAPGPACRYACRVLPGLEQLCTRFGDFDETLFVRRWAKPVARLPTVAISMCQNRCSAIRRPVLMRRHCVPCRRLLFSDAIAAHRSGWRCPCFFVFPDNKNSKTELLFTFAARSSDRAAERDGPCQWSCIWNAMGRHSWHVSKQRAVKSLLWVRHGTHFRTAGLSNLLWLRIFANRLDI